MSSEQLAGDKPIFGGKSARWPGGMEKGSWQRQLSLLPVVMVLWMMKMLAVMDLGRLNQCELRSEASNGAYQLNRRPTSQPRSRPPSRQRSLASQTAIIATVSCRYRLLKWWGSGWVKRKVDEGEKLVLGR
jgi:hypothetical protein